MKHLAHRTSSPYRVSHTPARSTGRLAMMAGIVAMLSACGNEAPSLNPLAPGSTPGAPIVTYTVSGIVSEMTSSGSMPVAGVRVDEGRSRQQVTTDETGLYSISGVSSGSSLVMFSKTGYVTLTRTVAVTGDTQLDLEVHRIVSYTLSGVVFETIDDGRVPIADVSVYCDSCGDPLGHTLATTNAEGVYSFDWTRNGATPLIVRKDGYSLPGTPLGPVPGWIVASVNGNTRFDIELIRH